MGVILVKVNKQGTGYTRRILGCTVMNRKNALLTLIITSLIFMPTTLIINNASAQSSSYTVQNVEHTVEVIFSGHTVVRDEIKISGSVANGFQIGIPSKYASSVLKVVAYDSNREYPVTLGRIRRSIGLLRCPS